MQRKPILPEEARARLLRRLNVVTSYKWPYRVQLAAVQAILRDDLAERDRLKQYGPEALLAMVRNPWETRTVYDPDSRKLVTRRLCRPPRSLADVWSG